MQEVAEFHKVSFEQFMEDSKKCKFINDEFPVELLRQIWESIKLPERSTRGSAGYDICTPYSFCMQKGDEVTVPTGLNIDIQPGWFLAIVPRSGLGFKYGMRLANTMGVIDSDYFYADNEGHIHVKFSVESNMAMENGDRFVQGILLQHGITRNDDPNGIRKGGFGSTGVK